MKIHVMSLLFLLITMHVFSQNNKSNLYSGGMLFYQPGYTTTSTDYQTLKNNSNSIGGILRFYISDYFTAGIYGGSQRTKYITEGSDNSYISLGYGGPFAGVSHKSGKFRYTLSVFAGMGSVKNLHVQSQSENKLTDAYLTKYPALVYSPILSVDYALNSKISFTLQGVYLIANYDNKFLYNPTLQFGILFNR